MVKLRELFPSAALVMLLMPRIHSLQWTSDFKDSTIVPACTHKNITFLWSFQLDEGETAKDIRWKFRAKGEASELVGIYGADDFLPNENFSDRIEFVANAGLILNHVTPADSGSYSVEVDVHDASKQFSEHVATVHLQVADFFKVSQELLAHYNDTTDSWHVQLKCGMFSSMEEPTGVTWVTPSGPELSTSYKDGYLYLQLPNPVIGGKYTCRLPPNTSTTACLPDDSALSRQPSYMVDDTKARLTLLEAENRQLKEMVHKHEAKLQTATLLVAFQARLSGSRMFSSSATVIMDQVLTNEGGAYNSSTGDFIVPYNGTYFFAVTAGDYDGSSNNYANVEMRVDDTSICKAYNRYSDWYDTSTCHATLHLVAGQRVWVRSETSNYLYNYLTGFSGFLISADE